MYMDALESEVEALSAEVTRLRLMLHRVTQAMDVPISNPHTPDSAARRSVHGDPMSATLGAGAWASTAPAAPSASAAAPSLAALAQLLRDCPAELLELLARSGDRHKGGRGRHGERSSRRRSHHRRHRSRRSTSESYSASSTSSRSSSASASPDEPAKADPPQEREVSRSRGSHSQASRQSLSDALQASNPSVPAPAVVAVSHSQPSRSGRRDEAIGLPVALRTLGPAGASKASLAEGSAAFVDRVAVAGGRPHHGGPGSANARRRSSATQESEAASSGELPPAPSRKAASPEAAKSPASARSSGAAEDTDADESYMSMGAMNDMLRFHSTSPAEPPLGRSAPSLVQLATPRAAAGDRTVVSVAEEASGFSYSALHGVADASHSGQDVRSRRRSDGVHPRILSPSSEDSGVDRQHGRSVLRPPSRQAGEGSEHTPAAESWRSPSEAQFNYSMLGSVGPSAYSFVMNQSRQLSATSASLAQSRGPAQAPAPSAMRPASSDDSTSEDGSARQTAARGAARAAVPPAARLENREVFANGDIVFGARKPIPVTAAAASAATVVATPAPASSHPASSAMATPAVGIRTPARRRTLLECIRDEAEESSDESSSEKHPSARARLAYPDTPAHVTSSRGSQPAQRSPTSSADSGSSTSPRRGGPSAPQRLPNGRGSQAARQPSPQQTPANLSIAYTAGDLGSLARYSPQLSPALAATGASVPLDTNDQSHALLSQHGAFPANGASLSMSVSGAYDYDFGFNSPAASRHGSGNGSPASHASPLSWMRSHAEEKRLSVDTQQLMMEGGYMFE